MAYAFSHPVSSDPSREGDTLIERKQNCEVIVQLVKNTMEDE